MSRIHSFSREAGRHDSARKMKWVFVLASLLPIFGLLPVSGAWALTLGNIELSSSLDEPLDARIPLRAFQSTDMETLQAALADEVHFSRAGLARAPMLDLLQFDAVRDPDGSAHIQITTDDAIDEPFLSFMLEVSWSRGRILREYTLLLDPPVYVDTGSATAATIREARAAAEAAPTGEEAQAGGLPMAQTRAPNGAAAPTEEKSDDAGTDADTGALPRKTAAQYGPVTAKDTLWSIATRFRPDGSVSMEQMMLAIQRYNPEAFSQNNINSLRAGAILRIPDLERIAALSRGRALAEVEKQHTAWEGIRQKLAQSPVAAPEGALAPGKESQAGQGGPKRSGRVEILSAGAAVKGVGEAGEKETEALRAEISLVKEDMDAKSRENTELKMRLVEAETLIRKFAHLMEIQSDEIHALKVKLASADAPDTGSPSADASSEPVETRAGDASPVVSDTVPAETTQAELAQADTVADTVPTEIVPEAGGEMAAQPAPERTAPVIEAPLRAESSSVSLDPDVAKPWLLTDERMDYLRDHFPLVAAAVLGGIIVIFILFASWLRGRPAKKTTGQEIAEELTEEIANETAIPRDSEVHMAPQPDGGVHGQKTTGMASKPPIIREKDKLSERATAPLGVDDERRAEKAEQPAPPPPAPDDSPDILASGIALDIGFGEDEALPPLKPDGAKKDTGPMDLPFDSRVGSGAVPVGVSDKFDTTMPPVPDWSLDFDSSDLQEISPPPKTADAATDTAENTQAATGENMNFDFGFDLDIDASSETGDDDTRFFEFPPADASSGIDEMQTKLDLAQAYTDMGDIEGARVILEEVLADGEDSHKTVARELLGKLEA